MVGLMERGHGMYNFFRYDGCWQMAVQLCMAICVLQKHKMESKNEPILKNINSYAVNGAVHYANALLHYTSYTDIISIGMRCV